MTCQMFQGFLINRYIVFSHRDISNIFELKEAWLD